MNLWNLLPAIRPRRTFESVVQELVAGLRDGSIALSKTSDPSQDARDQGKCATCREGTLAPTTLDYTAEMEHDGRAYTVTVNNLEVFVCDKCQARVLPDTSCARLEQELRRQAGLLMPSEIAERREQLGLSQKDFACLLGVAPATEARWESGAQIQPSVLNDFMQAFFDLPELQKYLRRRRGMASPTSRIVSERPA